MSGSGEDVGISLQASSNSIISMIKVLTTGLALTKVKSDLTEIEGVAMSLGIDLQNLQIGSKKKKSPAKSINSNNITASKKKSTLKTNVKQEKEEGRYNLNINYKSKECNICGDEFRDNWKMERHRNTHFNPASTTNKCDQCSLHFKNDDVLSRHKSMLHSEEGESGSSVDLYSLLKQENSTNPEASDDSPNVSLDEAGDPIGDTVNNGKEYECSQCFKTFAKKDKLNRHFLTHSGVKFGCEDCGSEFSRKDKLNKHRRDKHNVSAIGADTVGDNLNENTKRATFFTISDENEDNDHVNEEVIVDNEQSSSPNDKDANESNVEINATAFLSEEMEIPDEDLILD